jgi:hypothetical protein
MGSEESASVLLVLTVNERAGGGYSVAALSGNQSPSRRRVSR